MEENSSKFNILSIKLLDIFPSIDEISKNSEELLIIFQGNNSFFDLRELFELKKEIIIKIGKNKKTIIISLIKSDILFAKSISDIRIGEQWITFNYENKERKPLNFASSLVDCIKIKISCKSLNKDNNEFIVKKNSLNSLNNKNISQKINKNKFNKFSPMKFMDSMNINNDSNRLKTSFSYIPNKEYSNYYSVLTENTKGIFRPSQIELNDQKIFSTINKNDGHKMNFIISSRTKNNSHEKNKKIISFNDNSNNNIKGTDDDNKKLNLSRKENHQISLNQNLKINLGNIFISNGQLYQKEKEFYNDIDIKNYKKSMEKNSPKSVNVKTPFNSEAFKKDNISNKNNNLDTNISEQKEDMNFLKILPIQNQENKSEKEAEKNNNSSKDLSEEYYEINNFYKLKEDFLLLYNEDYNNNIKDDLLKLELELFIEKISELIMTYHNNINDKILENEILKNKYKANISEYLLIKKLYSKLNEIKNTKKSKIKSQLKNNNKFNDILNKDEMNLFKLIFPPLNEENLYLSNKKEQLKQILDIVLNKNENIKLLDQNININLINKIILKNSKSKNSDNDDKIIYKKKTFISKK